MASIPHNGESNTEHFHDAAEQTGLHLGGKGHLTKYGTEEDIVDVTYGTGK